MSGGPSLIDKPMRMEPTSIPIYIIPFLTPPPSFGEESEAILTMALLLSLRWRLTLHQLTATESLSAVHVSADLMNIRGSHLIISYRISMIWIPFAIPPLYITKLPLASLASPYSLHPPRYHQPCKMACHASGPPAAATSALRRVLSTSQAGDGLLNDRPFEAGVRLGPRPFAMPTQGIHDRSRVMVLRGRRRPLDGVRSSTPFDSVVVVVRQGPIIGFLRETGEALVYSRGSTSSQACVLELFYRTYFLCCVVYLSLAHPAPLLSLHQHCLLLTTHHNRYRRRCYLPGGAGGRGLHDPPLCSHETALHCDYGTAMGARWRVVR